MEAAENESDNEREKRGDTPMTDPRSPSSVIYKSDSKQNLPDTTNRINANVPEIQRLSGGSDRNKNEHTQKKARHPVVPEADAQDDAAPPVLPQPEADAQDDAAPPVLPQGVGESAETESSPSEDDEPNLTQDCILFNLEDKSVKRFMDATTQSDRLQDPSSRRVLKICADLLDLIKYDTHSRKCKVDDQFFIDLVKHNDIFKNCPHIHKIRENENNKETVEYNRLIRDLRLYFHKLGKYVNRAKNCLQRLNADYSLIYLLYLDAEMPDGRLVRVSVEEIFSTIVHHLDITYNKKLMFKPNNQTLAEMYLEVPEEIPSLCDLVRHAPRINYDGEFPRRLAPPYRTQEPNPATILDFIGSHNLLVWKECALITNSALVVDGSADTLYKFCRENPGSTFEVVAASGTGKTLALPTRLCSLGVVLLVQLSDLHVQQTVATLRRYRFSCEIRTERYAKFGFLIDEHRGQIFDCVADPEEQPALKRSEYYQPMRANQFAELYVCTYKTLRQLIKNADFPDLMILDDVRCENRDKDLSLFSLMHSRLPENMIIGGFCSSDLTSGKFTFDQMFEKRRAGATLRLKPSTPSPYPVVHVPDFCEQYVRWTNCQVISRLATDPDAMVQRLISKGREDLLPAIVDAGNQQLFENFTIKRETSELQEFASWLPDHFHRLLTNADLLTQCFEVLASRPRQTLLPSEHTRLLDSTLLLDIIKLYEDTLTTNSGAMLMFLPSAEAVIEVFEFLRSKNKPKSLVLPIVGPWSTDEIAATEDALQHDANGILRGRIILVSPESESSLTFKHVSIVVDSQLKYQKFMANTVGAEFSLMVSANHQETLQRRGRAGRDRAGIYLQMKPLSAPDEIPDFISSDPDCYQLEMRTAIMEILHLIECRGTVLSATDVINMTREWFPNMNESIIDAALCLMQDDGICVASDSSVYFTPLGHLIALLPGTFDENYLVAIGAAFGCFRSMAAYVVARNSLDLWDDVSERATAWRDFFNRGVPVPGRSHLDYVESIMYWYLKSERDNLAAARSNANPAILVALREQIRNYEISMYAYSATRERDWDWTKNDDDMFVRRMALFAGTHGNVCVLDDQENMVVVSTGHVVPCGGHNWEIPAREDVCRVRNLRSIGVFTRLRAGNATTPDKAFGITDGGLLLPLFFLDVTKPFVRDVYNFDEVAEEDREGDEEPDVTMTLILKRHIAVRGVFIHYIAEIRRLINKPFTAWIAGQTECVTLLGDYLKLIADFLRINYDMVHDFDRWNMGGLLGEKNPMPPAGITFRSRWCPKCLHQGHNRDQCLSNILEARRRHKMIRDGFLDGYLLGDFPCEKKSKNVASCNFQIPVDKNTGLERCCTCRNLWHSRRQCRSAGGKEGCLRCGDLEHASNDCTQPKYCPKCGIRIHLEAHCEEDRLMLEHLYQMPFYQYVRTVHAPRFNINYRHLKNVRPVALKYFSVPRVEDNVFRWDPAGPERHILEDARMGFI